MGKTEVFKDFGDGAPQLVGWYVEVPGGFRCFSYTTNGVWMEDSQENAESSILRKARDSRRRALTSNWMHEGGDYK